MRGDVHSLRASRSARGHEQAGRRYAVVIQIDQLAHLSTWFVVPTSASAGAAIYRPEIAVDGATTRALCEQAAGIDPQARLGEVVAHLTHPEMTAIEDAMRLLIGL
jgi:mRNA interferase MazF